MYPVGACYFSTVATSPATIVGGTWAAMTGGMLGLAGSTGVAGAASTGGSRKISTSQLPSHSHGLNAPDYVFSGESTQRYAVNTSNGSRYTFTTAAQTDLYWLHDTDATGGGTDYIPAHTSVYGWRRTA